VRGRYGTSFRGAAMRSSRSARFDRDSRESIARFSRSLLGVIENWKSIYFSWAVMLCWQRTLPAHGKYCAAVFGTKRVWTKHPLRLPCCKRSNGSSSAEETGVDAWTWLTPLSTSERDHQVMTVWQSVTVLTIRRTSFAGTALLKAR